MSNSSLVTYKKISPNRTSPRNHVIDTISIHCTAGEGTAKDILNLSHFVNYNESGGSSCNYAIGYDGSIGMGVEEKDRSWCTSSRSNDHRAITIEVSSSNKAPYKVKDAAYKSLIKLLVDICNRNNIKELKWQGNKSLIGQVDKQNMTVHRWFANKSCPGDYLYNLHGEIAAEVNAQLGSGTGKKGQTVYRVRKTWADTKTQKGAYHVLENAKKAADANPGYSVFDDSGKCLYPVADKDPNEFKVRVSITDLNIRKGPGTNYAKTGKCTGKGVFTIVETSEGKGATAGWGKLKSGLGWISLDYAKKI